MSWSNSGSCRKVSQTMSAMCLSGTNGITDETDKVVERWEADNEQCQIAPCSQSVSFGLSDGGTCDDEMDPLIVNRGGDTLFLDCQKGFSCASRDDTCEWRALAPPC